MMEKNVNRGIQRMSKYLQENYSSGSILERANYKKNIIKPYRMYDSMIERKIDKKDDTLWKKLRKIILK